jgi:glycosyltransferase involved in cell wall biosynthesis
MAIVSVIIPTHSRPQLLSRAVESARSAGADVEIIVVDDASTDETATVCRTLKGINYVRLDRNQGVAGARNVGILTSTGKYVAFLDDDDLRLPGSLDIQAVALDENEKVGFVCGAMIMADQEYQPTGEVFRPQSSGSVFWDLLELDFPVMPLSTLIRKECFLRVGLLNHKLKGIDDWDILTRIAELYQVLVIDQPMGVYRQPTPSSDQGSSSQVTQLLKASRHQLKLLELPTAKGAERGFRRAIRRRAVNRCADTLLWTSARHLVSGEYRAAFRNILGALRLNPLRIVRPRAYKKLAQRLIFGRTD